MRYSNRAVTTEPCDENELIFKLNYISVTSSRSKLVERSLRLTASELEWA